MINHITAGALIGAVSIALSLGMSTVQAAPKCPHKPSGYPSRPINLVVAYPPGGGMDVTARTLAVQLERVTDYEFRVQNKAGGGGLVGNTYVARQAEPDGYTVGILANPSYFIGILYRGAHYAKDDIVPIAGINFEPVVWGVRTGSDLAKVGFKGVIKKAKSSPGSVKIGVIPKGPFDFIAHIVQRQKGVKFTIVPYQGGKPSLVALLGGNIDVSSNYYSEIQNYIKAGKMKAIAVANTERYPNLPNTPTLPELGVDVAGNTWGAVRFAAVPAGTPKAHRQYLGCLIMKTLSQERTQKAFEKVGIHVVPLGVETAQKHYNNAYKAVRAYLKDAGMLKRAEE